MQTLQTKLRTIFADYRELIDIGFVSIIVNLAYGVLNVSAIQPYVSGLGLTAYLGAIYAIYMVSETTFRSPMGSVADRFGRRVVFAGAAIVGTAAAFCWTLIDKLWMILVVQVVGGAVFASFYTATIVAMSGAVDPDRRTSAMGAFIAILMAGIATGPVIGGYANDMTHTTLASFYVASAMFLLTAILSHFLIPKRMHEECSEGEDDSANMGSSLIKRIWFGLRSIPDYIAMSFFIYFPLGMIIPIVKLFGLHQIHLSETGFGLLFLGGALAAGTVALLSRKMVEQLGKSKAIRTGLATSAVGMYGVALTQTPWLIVISAGIVGLGLLIALPAWLALVSDVADPEVRGSVIGALGLGQGVGLISGILLGGYSYSKLPLDIFGWHLPSAYMPFLLSAFGLSLACALSLVLVKMNHVRVTLDGTQR